MTIDLDSTICEVHGHHKGGAAYGYTRQLGYHPLLATWAATGDVLHARMRKGSANTQRRAKRFVEELIARVRRNGASGPLCVRADSASTPGTRSSTLTRLDVAWSVTVNINASIRTAIEAISDDAWIDIAYPDGGVAQVAETTYVTGGGKTKRAQRRVRLVVRRTRLVDPAQLRLWPRLAAPHVRHQHRTRHGRGRRVPPRSRHRRVGDPRPQGRSRTRALPRRDSSTPTPPGWSAPCWPTTSPVGPPASATSIPPDSSPSPTPSVNASSVSPAGSSTARAAPPCACQPAGPGPPRSPPPSTRSAPCP